MQAESIKPMHDHDPHTTLGVVTGEHGHPIPPGLGDLVRNALQSRMVRGAFKLRMGPTVKGTNAMPRLAVVRVTARGTIELRCKPGGNDSARVCWLSIDHGAVTIQGKEVSIEWLAELLKRPLQNEGGNAMGTTKGAGATFTHNIDNIKAAVMVLAASGAHKGFILADRAKKALTHAGIGPGMTSASWGQVLGSMGRRGYLELRRQGEGLAAVKIAAGGMQWVGGGETNGHGKPVVIQASGHTLRKAPPLMSPPATGDLGAWLTNLKGMEEELLRQLVMAEEAERVTGDAYTKAKGEAQVLRDQLARASRTVEAMKLVMDTVSGSVTNA